MRLDLVVGSCSENLYDPLAFRAQRRGTGLDSASAGMSLVWPLTIHFCVHGLKGCAEFCGCFHVCSARVRKRGSTLLL